MDGHTDTGPETALWVLPAASAHPEGWLLEEKKTQLYHINSSCAFIFPGCLQEKKAFLPVEMQLVSVCS